MKGLTAFIGIALVLVLSSCYTTLNRNVDYGYVLTGTHNDASLVTMKDYETVGIVIVKSTEDVDDMGNHTGSQITYEMLMLEAKRLNADDIINIRIDTNHKEHFSKDGELEKITFNYTATGLAIKYTRGVIPAAVTDQPPSGRGVFPWGSSESGSVAAAPTARKYANIKNNWLSVGPIGAGLVLNYERMLSRNLSVGADIYYMLYGLFVFSDFGINAKARFYPWGKAFYLGAGLGVNSNEKNFNMAKGSYFTFTPELGWRIDVGKPGAAFVDLGAKVPLQFGGVPFFAPYIGFGGAF
jgi:uncharacterized protein YbjQ (UPF0145 family)